ncbi:MULTISPECIES: elongation factor P maturation arginine rhamnosyltransferase EarP [Roseateles]|uniref:Protein-arginine rhamnosyltransferase n=1 Tax=Pelomonas caseinilytica TaxID=2906763 RepID=A0ABS8XL25_9BURK|nr:MULTISPECIES: elongation factor P maturation arginine rhamnosyltransferase EarP [unclassified Roseateles]MCE4540395.1 elongation factor P maturation arginine rhamnosyltransferase EarP [Pelomonas sp. P7]HEV6965548.1 elongation factor P maturation arginine rhamnosyltransferase EarP [Roseateles sp.]
MDSADIWDIFYRPDDLAGMWFGFQLARSLGEQRQRVRLYCHDIQTLSVAHVNLDPRVLIQHLGSVEILDQRLARTIAAAPNLIEIFDGAPPAPYMARFFSMQSGGNWYSLHAPWSRRDVPTAIQLRTQSQTHRQFDVNLGDSSQSAGLIRSVGQPHVLRTSPQSLLAARASILSLLGLSSDLLEADRTLYVSASAGIAWPQWLRALIESETSHCLFVEHGELQEKIAPIFSRVPGQPGTSSIGALTVVFLPPLLWALVDEIINICDLVLTDRDDVAFRAAERGTPSVRAQAAPTDTDMAHWLFPEPSSNLAECYRGAAAALGTGRGVPENLDAFMARLEDFKAHARQVQARVGRASDLVALLLTSSEISTASNVERLFAPTQPNPML